MKLDPMKDHYEQDFGWVAHPEGGSNGPVDLRLIERRHEIEIIGGIIDEEACYEYDEFALCELAGKYYLLQTSGCSCPSPSETWQIDIGPATLDEISEFIRGGHYDGYTLPKKREAEFLDLIESAKRQRVLEQPSTNEVSLENGNE